MRSHILSAIVILSLLISGFDNEKQSGSKTNSLRLSLNECNYTWTSQGSGTSDDLKSVCAVSDSIGWAGGSGPTVRKTTNGGTNWTNATGTGITGTIYNIFAWSVNEAICASYTGTAFIYKTTNGGTTWTQVFSQTGGFINALQMVSATEGYGLGDPVGGNWTVVKTTNGGTNWARMATEPVQVGGEAGYHNSFQIIGNNMWFGTNNTKVYRSTNLGVSWSSGATTGTTNTNAVHFNGSTSGLAGGNAMVKSTDGGVSYSTVTSPGFSGNINGLEGLSSDWWSIRSDSSVYRSTNQGTNWSTAYSRTGAVFQDIDFIESDGCSEGWVVGNSGVISKMSSVISADFEVTNVYALGESPEEYNDPDTVCIRVTKKAEFADTIKLCMRISNQDSTLKYNEVITIPNLVANDTTVCVELPLLTPLKTDLIIVNALVEDADKAGKCILNYEGSETYCRTVTYDSYSYTDNCKSFDGGFGFTGRTGNFVAGFRNKSTDTFSVSAVDLSFLDSAGGGSKSYRVVIYGDNGSGKPGSLLYLSSALTSPSGTGSPVNVTHLINPSIKINPNTRFYTGYRQTSVSNLRVSYQNEIPVRKKSFFFTTSDTGTAWFDFSDSLKNLRFEVTPRTGMRFEMTAYIQGFYKPALNNMTSDTIKVILRNATTPYARVDSARSKLFFNGSGNFIFNNAANAVSYYIVIRHRNSIETWSAAGNSFTGNLMSYNFSTSAAQAFGSNQASIDSSPSRFGIYSGDVNQDEIVDGADLSLIDNDASNFATGYIVTDLTGDDIVDASDAALGDNNAANFIGLVRP